MRPPAEQRERELTRRKGRLAAKFSIRLVGCPQQPGYPGNVHQLADLEAERDADSVPYPVFNGEMAQQMAENDWFRAEEARGIPIPMDIVREPDNEHDPNAVRIDHDGEPVGYITRPVAARLTAELDEGIEWEAVLDHVYIDDNHRDQPGISVTLRRLHVEQTA